MRCSEVGLQTQEMLANNRNSAVKPTAFEKRLIGPHRGDDSQLGPLRAKTVGLTDDSQLGPLRANNTVGLTDDSQLGPLRANNTVESVHYRGHSTIRNDAKAVRFLRLL
jgi:hypothetical protein